MNKIPKKFNYTKWGFFIGLPALAISSITAIVTIPEIGCKVGWNTAACNNIPNQEIEIYTQAETGEFLSGVKIQFMAKGAPEVQYTDNNGYAKVKIPSKGDVRVNLIKQGYPIQDLTINIGNSQPTSRVIRFSKSGQPKIDQFSSSPVSKSIPASSPISGETAIPSPSPISSPTNTQSNEGISFQNKGCKRKNEVIKCEFIVTDQEQNRSLQVFSGRYSPSTRIIDHQGTQYLPELVNFGSKENDYVVEQNLVQNIGLKGIITFKKVPNQINKMALVEIAASTREKGTFTIQFRDVAISN